MERISSFVLWVLENMIFSSPGRISKLHGKTSVVCEDHIACLKVKITI